MRHITAAVLIAALAAAGCTGNSAAPGEATAQTNGQVSAQADLGRAFDIKIGQSVVVGELLLTFQRVEGDSRCPIDAMCVWAGDAEIALRIQQGGQAAVAALHTTLEPRQTVWNGYTIKFVSLAPSRNSATPLDPADYKAQLVVSR